MELPVTIKLKRPIYEGSREITELVFNREPEAADLYDIEYSGNSSNIRETIKLASRLTGEPFPILGKLKMVDLKDVNKVVSDFLLDGQETGEE
jgi:hypothetical protein